MSCSKPFAEKLQAIGYRMTPQRHAILHTLKTAGKHLSPGEVYAHARQAVPGLTETTVYRTLEFLAENNIVQSMLIAGGHLVYEIAESDHEHLFCRACGKEIEVARACLQPLFAGLEASTGFRSIAGNVTFSGLCPDCQ
jgi:Fe2+ or Zn2+ uptake regulation protein